jgi:hypothetical protein
MGCYAFLKGLAIPETAALFFSYASGELRVG